MTKQLPFMTDIAKVRFIDRNTPIEIFCSKKYKDYYIRGQIFELCTNIYDKKLEDDYANAYYHITTLVLVHENFQLKQDFDYFEDEKKPFIRSFHIKTPQEFKQSKRKSTIECAKMIGKKKKNEIDEFIQEEEQNENPMWILIL